MSTLRQRSKKQQQQQQPTSANSNNATTTTTNTSNLTAVDEHEIVMQQSFTELPVVENATGKPQKDYTLIPSTTSSAPTAEETKEPAKSHTNSSGIGTSTTTTTTPTIATGSSSIELAITGTPRSAMTGSQVSKDESRG
eukprot:CAMPEP_0117037980 /NCGR_PEP_ID=MMETSP0472-20121206/26759_1 /TAXON_ID=693140 ORGANISM="Tiarina fusus, Strain LIS" /NCGR_SAMPLE_ID=MMETSP0472 /ASSEMBLY_ACC=CAM_ASM_000603 /LENGTH=138 /DNA_ID=CAMNT_0004748089 /DNA_START=100 /DNA_END=512 /DNA_ORIENTATION=-